MRVCVCMCLCVYVYAYVYVCMYIVCMHCMYVWVNSRGECGVCVGGCSWSRHALCLENDGDIHIGYDMP